MKKKNKKTLKAIKEQKMKEVRLRRQWKPPKTTVVSPDKYSLDLPF